jgi:hypothetical protein
VDEDEEYEAEDLDADATHRTVLRAMHDEVLPLIS